MAGGTDGAGVRAMTEEEWHRELELLRTPASDRKARLFAVACCRRVWDVMSDPCHRAVVEQFSILHVVSAHRLLAAVVLVPDDAEIFNLLGRLPSP